MLMIVLAACIILAAGGTRWLFYGSAEVFGRIWGEYDKRKARRDAT